MKTSEGETPPPILSYADNETLRGISIMRDEGMLRLIVPPVPGWKHLGQGLHIAGASFSFALIVATFKLYSTREPEIIVPVVQFGIALFIVLLIALYRLHRRIIFDITGDELALTFAIPFMAPSRSTWSRKAVGEIKRNTINGKLLIRITGTDLVEINVSQDEKVVDWIAGILDAELHRPPSVVKSPIASAEAKTFGAEDVVAAKQRRRIGVITSASMVAAGVLLIVCGSPYEIFGVYILLFSCVPIGIALGTHEREYYL